MAEATNATTAIPILVAAIPSRIQKVPLLVFKITNNGASLSSSGIRARYEVFSPIAVALRNIASWDAFYVPSHFNLMSLDKSTNVTRSHVNVELGKVFFL